ncbi:MAG: segregation/condensation protein A [Pyrinomonadaceae bacterium]|nr:segregation/condensation protein A [Pyrinomonadaceae bacterium]MCX7640464.1 segregation/condensation protein A [Pyrinomonadaceae bacterium]
MQEQIQFDFYNLQPQIQEDGRTLRIGDFAGPLDLLLFLIKQEKANIFDIPIAKITDEYLRYIRLMEKLDIAVASEFLVMAAILIEIKSKMLLPQPPTESGTDLFEDPRLKLVERLVEYEKFKTAAQMLWEKATIEQSIFRRGKNNSKELIINATPFDLFEAFQRLLKRQIKEKESSIEVEAEKISIENVIKNLKEKLIKNKSLSLFQLAKQVSSKLEFIVSFLAILEIVRTEGVVIIQKRPFGDVIIMLSGN